MRVVVAVRCGAVRCGAGAVRCGVRLGGRCFVLFCFVLFVSSKQKSSSPSLVA